MSTLRISSISLLLGIGFSINHTYAQEQLQEFEQFSVPYSNLEATIDGELDDPIWTEARTIELDIVNSPWDNEPSPVKTQAKIIENGEFLFIAFTAEMPNPEDLVAALGDRDSRWGDELIGIKLDTANNRRLNYTFLVNPYGVQHDRIFNEMTGLANSSWDGIWNSYGKITDTGYQVEIAIPYRTLNFENNQDKKQWAFELLRSYKGDTSLRISHVPLDKNNACWLCQYPELVGFDKASAGKNLTVTPSAVASSNETRDLYDPNNEWKRETDVEAGLDLRWGINPNNLLNLTVNPDFSTVEADAGQLTVNKTYSLFYEEKRAFFLENSDYFSSNFELVYTRNIADPDYGAKFTGSHGNNTYAFFATNDTETNFIKPGNIGSSITSLEEESHSSAFKYRYDFNDDFSVGLVNTIRAADNYYNIVTGLDTKYRFDSSNSILAQIVSADSKTPELNNPKTHIDTNDTALKVDLIHDSEYWTVKARHQQIGKDFRADLGFMPKADYQQQSASIKRSFYGDSKSLWSYAELLGEWDKEKNEDGDLLGESYMLFGAIKGPSLSELELKYTVGDQVGLRFDPDNSEIIGNTSLFKEKELEVYFEIQPIANLELAFNIIDGDRIDYANDRLGDYREYWTELNTALTKHLSFNINYTYGVLDADGAYVYKEQLTDLRLNYQFNVRSYLKLSMVYSDIDFNPNNNPNDFYSEKNKNLSTQLIYSYKINPQTLFFLGYSDRSFQDDYIKKFDQEERTFFTKISYAWMP